MARLQQVTINEDNQCHRSTVSRAKYSWLSLQPHRDRPADLTPRDSRYSSLRKKFSYLTEAGQDLLASLLAYDPESRISAEVAGRHRYFE